MNLVRYTYRMTPISELPNLPIGLVNKAVGKDVIPASGGYGMLKRAAKLREEGKLEEAAALSYEGRAKIRDSTVGTALIATSMIAQLNDPSVPMHQDRDSDGDLIDISGAVPYAQIRAVAAATNVLFRCWF